MGDLIERQAVLKICRRYWHPTFNPIMEEVEKLPSAQSEQKKGEWIPHEDEDGEHYGDKCSECGEWYVMPYGKTNFCPSCGARME